MPDDKKKQQSSKAPKAPKLPAGLGQTPLVAASIPYEWRLHPEGNYTQLSFPQCDLAKLPRDLRDGHGKLAGLSGTDVRYALPSDLTPDSLDRDAEARAAAAAKKVKARFKALEAERKAEAEAAAAAAGVAAALLEPPMPSPAKKSGAGAASDVASEDESQSESESRSQSEDESDEDESKSGSAEEISEDESGGSADGNDEESDGEDTDLPPMDERPPKGHPCVSIRLPSNNIHALDSKAFGGVHYLCSLDLSTNHLAACDLQPELTPRLQTLSLRNNQLASLGGIAALTSLRRLDVSFNRLASLDGAEGLTSLRVLLAGGNQLSGPVPLALAPLSRLTVLDLSANQLDGHTVDALSGLQDLSTLRLANNRLPVRTLVEMAEVVSRLSLLRRIELFGNPLQSDPSYPDALLTAQPSLAEVDHMRQQVGELAAGMAGGAVSRRTVGEAIDAVANAALAQHALNLERHRAAHAALVATLQAQQEEATRALEEYRIITAKAEDVFRERVAEARRVGKSEAAVDAVLERRKEVGRNPPCPNFPTPKPRADIPTRRARPSLPHLSSLIELVLRGAWSYMVTTACLLHVCVCA